jgi:NADH-quinone oxidoreductase subunit N
MFFEKPDSEVSRINPDRHLQVAFVLNATALLVLGVFSNAILSWCLKAFPVA